MASQELFENEVTLEVIQNNFASCFEEYFADIFDLFQSEMFSLGKKHALETVRRVEKIVGRSIRKKLELLDESSPNTIANKIREEIKDTFGPELQTYEAVLALVRAYNGILIWAVGSAEFPMRELAEYRELVEALPNSVPERLRLLQCADFIQFPSLENDTFLTNPRVSDETWMVDALETAAIMSNVIALINEHGENKLFVFVSHYMGTADTDGFFRRLLYKTDKEFNGKIVVWTGHGPTRDILRSIIARIWLSDSFITYVPNSLADYSNGQKNVGGKTNWLIDEALIARSMGLYISQVVANDSKLQQQALIEQVENYDCTILDPLICRFQSKSDKQRHLMAFLGVLKGSTYVKIVRTTGSFSDKEWEALKHQVFKKAVNRQVANMVTTIRLRFRADVWFVIQKISVLLNDSRHKRRSGVTAAELANVLKGKPRRDKGAYSVEWIRRNLPKADSSYIKIGSKVIPLLRIEGLRPKYYSIALTGIIDAINSEFGCLANRDAMYNAFWQRFRVDSAESEMKYLG